MGHFPRLVAALNIWKQGLCQNRVEAITENYHERYASSDCAKVVTLLARLFSQNERKH